MNAADISRIRSNPVFLELERKRNSFCWSMFAIMVLIYGGFILTVALAPAVLAQPIGGGTFTLAFPVGLGVIAAAIIMTAIYVVRANSEFDRLTREIVGQNERATMPVGGVLGSAR